MARISLIEELEDAIHSGSSAKRVETLRRVTDLFLNDNSRLTDEQIDVFDDVIGHLITRIETKARVELSDRLAPVENAPIDVIQRLARDDEIAVAGPVLAQSSRLETSDLVEIVHTKSQDHLLAISARSQLNNTVTDALLERGNGMVVDRLVRNTGAEFSENGFRTLIGKSQKDDRLAEKIGLRLDLPIHLLRELLKKASDYVRARLMAIADPDLRNEINDILSEISVEIIEEENTPHDFSIANLQVGMMKDQNQLDEIATLQFAKDRDYEKTIVGISMLCSVPVETIERLAASRRPQALIIPCKAAGFRWTTMSAILQALSGSSGISEQDLAQAKTEFLRLSKASADRVLRFWHAREVASQTPSA